MMEEHRMQWRGAIPRQECDDKDSEVPSQGSSPLLGSSTEMGGW